MRLRSMLMPAVVGLTLAFSLGGPAVANASAATIHPAASTTHLATPDNEGECNLSSLPAVGVHLFNEDNAGGDEWSCACNTDTVYSNFLDPIKSVQNACPYRIYLQQFYGGSTGWSYCIDGGSIRNDIGVKYQDPASMKVGASEQPC
jgi:hypothetical protein